MPKLDTILIANRGEIALRIIRACRELGIRTVLVYSEADRDSVPARMADRAICIGKPAARKSYLNAQAIVGAAVAYRCDAIHPGYGFLSENAEFAALCEAQGVIFVGPASQTIRDMGDKIAAKALAKAAGVPTTPGSDGAITDPRAAETLALSIGFPILIKAAAGGGGRGMRIVRNASELAPFLSEAMSEALSAFGDGSVYIEKYLENIRHVEVQVLGDGERVVHLGERDCTTQRRNQKLLEEAPCIFIPLETRAALGAAAVRLCEAVDYRSAGTVEFIYDQPSKAFYFIEMNTRIQVEHPVTEMITGIDLVKEQLLIARGEKLRFAQSDIRFDGHAIECRINAEDPQAAFAPSPGRIDRFAPPGGPGVRVDSHLEAGYTIPPFYDSMVAKLICWGRDRDEARHRVSRALGELRIDGVTTTAQFHQALVLHPDFVSGNFNTRFVHDVLGY
ncbi:MAG: acetyl-CoA carboxylase biotin carboxylase subunit [Methylobacteriaceae bacterium]|nr:acetyl-CoA carboxylase biotin carboxylase subunit [Methylobacteriaceae bacterium]